MLTLHTVAHGSRCPAKEKARSTSLSIGELEPIAQRLVLLLVDLETALDQIEGCHHRVSQTAREETSETAKGIILGAAKLAGVLLGGCSFDHSFFGHLAFD